MVASEAEIDPAAEEKRLQEIFDEIDEDHSHTLERQEIQHLAERTGHPLSEAELDTAMLELDTNGSGHIKFQEFRSWYHGRPSRGRSFVRTRRAHICDAMYSDSANLCLRRRPQI